MVGLGVVALLALAAVWYGLVVKVNALRAAERVVQEGFRTRHDLIPLLVETEGAGGAPQSKIVERLVVQRSEARLARTMQMALEKEEALEASLKQVIKEGQKIEALKKNLGWLEARTELQKTTKVIEEALEHYERARGVLATELLRFPARIFRGVARTQIRTPRRSPQP